MSTHRCPAHGCRAQINDHRLSCRDHWYELPKELRDRIWDTYRKGAGGPDHTEAVMESVRFLRAEPVDEPVEA